MNVYIIRYIDYYNDSVSEEIVCARTKKEALYKFKKNDLKYWRIIDVELVKENV